MSQKCCSPSTSPNSITAIKLSQETTKLKIRVFFVTLSHLLDLNERGTIISFILLDWGSYAWLCFAFMFQLKIILVRLLGLRGTAPKFILCLSFFNNLCTLLNCCLLQKQQMPGASALTLKAVCLNIPIPVYPMLWSLSAGPITQRSVYGDDTSNHSSIALNNRHSLAKSSTSVRISNC